MTRPPSVPTPRAPRPPHDRTLRRWLPVLVLVLGGLLCSLHAGAAAEPAGHPPLARLAARLADGPAPLRADLAGAAATELAAAYASEADRARAELRRRPGDRDLRRWMRAVEGLAAEMAALAARVTPLTPVDVRVGPDGGVHLIIEGRPVLVNSPRPREQRALEGRVIERFCSLNLCTADLLEDVPPPTAETPSGPARAVPLWSFSRVGPVCSTDNGLEFQFDSAADLRGKRIACAAVVTELEHLADAITHGLAEGARVDWNALVLIATSDPDRQRLRLHRGGGELQVRAPALLAAPELFALSRSWLVARVRGERHHLVILHADRLMAALTRQGY